MNIPDTSRLPEKPWENRQRLVPLRTYSGKITYPKPTHYFSPKDIARILKGIPIPEENPAVTIQGILDAIILALSRVLSVVFYTAGSAIIDILSDFIMKIVGIIYNAPFDERVKTTAIKSLITRLGERIGLLIK